MLRHDGGPVQELGQDGHGVEARGVLLDLALDDVAAHAEDRVLDQEVELGDKQLDVLGIDGVLQGALQAFADALIGVFIIVISIIFVFFFFFFFIVVVVF